MSSQCHNLEDMLISSARFISIIDHNILTLFARSGSTRRTRGNYISITLRKSLKRTYDRFGLTQQCGCRQLDNGSRYFLIFKDGFVFIFCVSVCRPVYKCTACVPGAFRSLKRVLDPQKLELLVVVSPHKGPEY